MQSNDAAYIAGFIDADGAIMLHSKSTNNPNLLKAQFSFTPKVEITNKSNAVMEWIISVTNFNNNIIKFKEPLGRQRNVYYRMFFTGTNIRNLLPEIIPHLKIKKKQALLLLDIMKLFDNVQSTGGNFRLRSEEHNKNVDDYISIWFKVSCLNSGIEKATEMLFRKFGKQPEELLGHPNV